MLPLRISGTTSSLTCSRQLRRCVAQISPPLASWDLVMEWACGKSHCCKRKAVEAWKTGKGIRASHRAAKRRARHLVHHVRLEANKKVYENIDPNSSEVYRLDNQFRRENADVVGDKPMKNDAGEMSMSENWKQKAWLEHYLPKAFQCWLWPRPPVWRTPSRRPAHLNDHWYG